MSAAAFLRLTRAARQLIEREPLHLSDLRHRPCQPEKRALRGVSARRALGTATARRSGSGISTIARDPASPVARRQAFGLPGSPEPATGSTLRSSARDFSLVSIGKTPPPTPIS
jgi:hypothetical protein